MSTLRTRHHTGDGQYFCALCNEPVKLEDAKTDGDGHAVHGECYLDNISVKGSPNPKKPPAAQT
jgi:hypothetical protein